MSRRRTLASRVEVARHCGVSAPTVSNWISKGWLPPDGPWTRAQVTKALGRGLPSRRGVTSEHGTPARWRSGCHCDLCRRAHSDAQRDATAARAVHRWATLGPQLFELLASGHPYGDALATLEVTAQAVTAHRRRDPDFAELLDEALMQGRDPQLVHGTSRAWRAGCRCPDCREHHEASRHPHASGADVRPGR